MRAWFRITLWVAGGAVLLLALLWGGVFHTPPGRAAIKAVLTQELGDALDSTAEIGALRGALPQQIIVEDVTLSDPTGVWLTADRLTLRWRPFALLRGRIIIDDALLEAAHLIREPELPEEEEDEDALQIVILGEAPHIEIGSLRITDARLDLGGTPQILNGDGALFLDGPEIALRLSLQTDQGRDSAEIDLRKSAGNNQFALSATLNSAADGAIAALLGLDEPLVVSATGGGPASAAVISLESALGAFGQLSGDIVSDFDGFSGADLDLAFAPGAAFSGVGELSAPVRLVARYDVRQRGGALAISRLSSAIGEIEGALDWQAPRGFVERFNADLRATLSQTYRPDLQALIGEAMSLDAALNWRRDRYALEGALSGDKASLTIAGGETDLRRFLRGDLAINLAPSDDGPEWRTSGVALTGHLDLNEADRAALRSAALQTRDGSRFAGDASYQFTDEAITLEGAYTLTPAFLSQLVAGIDPGGAVEGDLTLSGALDRLTLAANLETPALRMNGGALPPLNVEIALSGLPELPNGELRALARDGGPRRLEAQLRASGDGVIRVSNLSYEGRGFASSGVLELRPAGQTVRFELAYAGQDSAEPWPGILALGDLTAKGVLSRDGALNQMTAEASAFAVNDAVRIENMALGAEGPPGAVRIELAADRLTVPGAGDILDLNASGQLNARTGPRLTLTGFDAIIQNSRFRTTEPAAFDFQSGVTIENLRAQYGASGSIALDGAFSSARWQADAVLNTVNIPQADGQLSAVLSLDTDLETPARGDLALRSLLLEDAPEIAAAAVWNGETVRLTNRSEDSVLDLDVRLPLRLQRRPALSVDVEGALEGAIRYDGDIQLLAAYMPPVLQTIEGDLAAAFELDGALDAPRLRGEASLSSGAYTELQSGFSLADLTIRAQADYSADGAAVTFTGGGRGAGQSNRETLRLDGALTLGEASNLNLDITLDRATFSAFPVSKAEASGKVALSGPLDALAAAGAITIHELDAEIATPEDTGLVDIEVIAFNDGAVATPEALADPPDRNGVGLDIRLEADDRIFIRGRGLESEWSAQANIENGRGAPLVLGAMTLRRGWLDFSGRRFDLTRGVISFDRLNPNNPNLDIRAELATEDGVTAAIVVSGRADAPKIELTSSPVLPSEDVMALVLFGKPAQDLSAFESLQTAEALASLGGVGPFGGGGGITGRLRSTVGLDLLNFDIDPENGGGSVTVGKYVADGLFVSASQDAQGKDGSVSVKYEITDNIVVETELEQNGDQTLSANWKKDF